MKKIDKSELWGFKAGDRIETTKSYCMERHHKNPKELYHSGKIITIHNVKKSIGSQITFISEQSEEIQIFSEQFLQPYRGLKFQGNDVLITGSTLESTLLNIEKERREKK